MAGFAFADGPSTNRALLDKRVVEGKFGRYGEPRYYCPCYHDKCGHAPGQCDRMSALTYTLVKGVQRASVKRCHACTARASACGTPAAETVSAYGSTSHAAVPRPCPSPSPPKRPLPQLPPRPSPPPKPFAQSPSPSPSPCSPAAQFAGAASTVFVVRVAPQDFRLAQLAAHLRDPGFNAAVAEAGCARTINAKRVELYFSGVSVRPRQERARVDDACDPYLDAVPRDILRGVFRSAVDGVAASLVARCGADPERLYADNFSAIVAEGPVRMQTPHYDSAGRREWQVIIALHDCTSPTLVYAGEETTPEEAARRLGAPRNGVAVSSLEVVSQSPNLFAPRYQVMAGMRPACSRLLCAGEATVMRGGVMHAGPALNAGQSRAVLFFTIAELGARATPTDTLYDRDAQTTPIVGAVSAMETLSRKFVITREMVEGVVAVARDWRDDPDLAKPWEESDRQMARFVDVAKLPDRTVEEERELWAFVENRWGARM